jgi:tyrosyl-tRNA synthetase
VIPEEQIKKNAEEFIRQVKMVLRDDPEVFEIRRNSEWLGAMSAKDLLNLMSLVTNDHLRSRDMFRNRIAEGVPVYEHELIYPILQGYDSVALNADLTVIGTDQLYNEMMGRTLQGKFGQKPQVIITTKITPGIDGKEKQSKSIGNYIGLAHSPRDKFGRVMSIPDHLVATYFEVYTTVPMEEVATIANLITTAPMECKLRLAEEVVARYHGRDVAIAEREWFTSTFSRKQTPTEIPEVVVPTSSLTLIEALSSCFGTSKSKAELRRLILQNGVKVDDITATTPDQQLQVGDNGPVVKVGKRNWFKLTTQR